jgi:sulfur carrier protein ThiS
MREGSEMNSDDNHIGIHIGVHGHCHEFFSRAPGDRELRIKPGQSLQQIMTIAGIKPQLIMGVLVNGKPQNKDYHPSDGDRIVLLSPPSGG